MKSNELKSDSGDSEPFTGSCLTELQESGPGRNLETRLAEWVELTEQKRGLEAQLRTVQEKLTAIEEPLLEDFTLAGFQNAKIHGMTVYKSREFFCRAKEGVEKATLINAFREAGMENAIGLQWQTLRALSKEWSEAGEEPPAAIRDLVNLGETFRLRARKG